MHSPEIIEADQLQNYGSGSKTLTEESTGMLSGLPIILKVSLQCHPHWSSGLFHGGDFQFPP
jgi:hypothetical protein